jgi:hypothetical protein
MTSELKTHLSKQLAEEQSKYTYFLLAVAASAIALAVQRTTGRALTLNMIPLGLAVACWLGSFFAGCRNRAYFSSTLYANVALLQVRDGTDPNVPSHPDAVAAAAEGVREAAERNSSMGNFWGHWQFRLLIIGAACFLVWHVVEMMYVVPNAQVAPNKGVECGGKIPPRLAP